MAQQTPPPGPPPGTPAPAGGPPVAPTGPGGLVLPEGWQRLVSALIDFVIVAFVGWLLQTLILGGTAATTVDPDTGLVTNTGGFFTGIFGSIIVTWVFQFLYFTVLNGMEKGQTVGKMIMKLQLRDELAGGPIGMGKSALRTLVMIALSIPCGIGLLVSFLFPLWDPKRQTLHDKAVKSNVYVAS